MLKKKKIYIVPVLGFSIVILIGAILLSLPICNNKPIDFIDSLFVATSGISVDGFTTVVISEQFNFLGQLILLILVEIGALGFMSFIIFILTVKNRKLRISDLILASSSINDEVYSHVKSRIKHIIQYTIIIELIGAILLSFRFVPIYGVKKGIWCAIFHSITAFCNAGFDIIGNASLSYFRHDTYVNIVLMILIILGGIGFFVIEELIKCFKKRNFTRLSFHTKLILSTTSIIFVVSVILFKLIEPNFTLLESAFTSVTLRTAGFYTVSLVNTSQPTKILAMILMFIGGAPNSTSGGIRVAVFAILVLTIYTAIKNRKEVVIFYRKINQYIIRKAIAITGISICIIFIATIAMLYLNNIGLENILFHCISAYSATGIAIYDLSLLNIYGKIILIFVMFIGRIGPISAVSLFLSDRNPRSDIEYVEGKVML